MFDISSRADMLLDSHIKKHITKETKRLEWSVIFDIDGHIKLEVKDVLANEKIDVFVAPFCPHKIAFDQENFDEISEWLAENCTNCWMLWGNGVWFRDEKDAVMFRLWKS